MTARQNQLLTVGERVRLEDGGPVFKVIRVTPCAAYLRGGKMRHVVIRDLSGEISREFDAESSQVIAVSCRAFVYRVAAEEPVGEEEQE